MSRAAAAPNIAQGLLSAALLLALGNLAGRLLGLGRVAVIAGSFGRQPVVDAFAAAWTVPNIAYDLLIGGIASAALVPVLSTYAETDAPEFWRLVAALLNVTLLLTLLVCALIAWQTPLLVTLLVQRSAPALFAQTVELVRQLLPTVVCLCLAGVAMAAHTARRSFAWTAFATAAFNAAMIAGVLSLRGTLGGASLAAGALAGAAVQLLLQLIGLRGLRLTLALRHPALRQIGWLAAPLLLGVLSFLAGALLDRWLASGFPAALATMQYATTLVQLPLGLIAAAVSLAALPTLARHYAAAHETAFAQTVAQGLTVVLFLVIPATVGLALLAEPITALLFQRGAFTAADTASTALALRCYLPGLPLTAVAQVLLFACYARQQTLAANLIQVAAIAIYAVAALALLRVTQLGYLALILANAVQWTGHALLLLLLTARHVRLRGHGLGRTLGTALVAGGTMAVSLALSGALLSQHGALIHLLAGGVTGTLVYLGVSAALRATALTTLLAGSVRRLRR